MNEVHVAVTAKTGPTKPNATPPLLKAIHAVASCKLQHPSLKIRVAFKRETAPFRASDFVAVCHELLDHLGRKPKPKKGVACYQFHAFILQIKAPFPESTSLSRSSSRHHRLPRALIDSLVVGADRIGL